MKRIAYAVLGFIRIVGGPRQVCMNAGIPGLG